MLAGTVGPTGAGWAVWSLDSSKVDRVAGRSTPSVPATIVSATAVPVAALTAATSLVAHRRTSGRPRLASPARSRRTSSPCPAWQISSTTRENVTGSSAMTAANASVGTGRPSR